MEIYRINTGNIYLKGEFLDKPNIPPDLREILTNGYPVNNYIIKYNNRNIIIDAGFSPGLKYPLGRFLEKSVFNTVAENNESLDNICNADIFLTHLHSDHIGYLTTFSKCKSNRFISNKTEYNQSRKFLSYRNGYLHSSIKNIKFVFIDMDTINKAVCPFLYSDFYNDDTFVILSTPGHSKGHSSFLLKYNKYKLLFTGDLIRGFHEFK